MKRKKWTDEQFILAVKTSLSYAEVIRKLNLKPAGSNYDTVKRKIKELNLSISHMTGQRWNIGKRYRNIKISQPIQQILVKDSTFISSDKLRKRLLKEQIKEYKSDDYYNRAGSTPALSTFINLKKQ